MRSFPSHSFINLIIVLGKLRDLYVVELSFTSKHEVLTRHLELIDFDTLIFSVKLPICSVQKVYELVARFAAFLDKVSGLDWNNFFNLIRKVFKRIYIVIILLLRLSNTLCFTSLLLFLLLLFKKTQPLFLSIISFNLLSDSLVVIHFLLHDVVFDPLNFLKQSGLLLNRLLNQDVVLTEFFWQL